MFWGNYIMLIPFILLSGAEVPFTKQVQGPYWKSFFPLIYDSSAKWAGLKSLEYSIDVSWIALPQGPLPNTTRDFWQMVWEQDVVVIAMVTLEREGGKVSRRKTFVE